MDGGSCSGTYDDGVILRFLVPSLGESTPVEIQVMHERANRA